MPFQLATPSAVLPATLPDSVVTVCACAAPADKALPIASAIIPAFIVTSPAPGGLPSRPRSHPRRSPQSLKYKSDRLEHDDMKSLQAVIASAAEQSRASWPWPWMASLRSQ
ncbi:hypothetical protein QP166_12480 [Sphingomonas sp. LR60]|uniref:hypothetical protein n=1 Tax=Sphingomonas sp. LR60 TaxID=3050233 RepID=UPI002FE10F5A